MSDWNDFFSSKIFSARARTYWIYKEIQAYDLANRATLIQGNYYCKLWLFWHLFRYFSYCLCFQVLKQGQLDGLEPMTMSRLVELSVVAPSGSDSVAEDMRTFAEQLKPYPY